MPVIDNQSTELSSRSLESLVTLPCSRRVTGRIRSLLPEVLSDIGNEGWIAPKSCFEIEAVERIGRGRVILDGGVTLFAPLVAHRLGRATHILFGAATIGTAMADEIRRCFTDGQNLKAVLMEEMANIALFEAANELLLAADHRASAMGLNTSGPLSPGDFEGFGLDQQGKVISLARADRLDITLTRAGQMHPVHSVSVIIGIGKKMRKWTRIDDCKACRSRDRCSHYLRCLDAVV